MSIKIVSAEERKKRNAQTPVESPPANAVYFLREIERDYGSQARAYCEAQVPQGQQTLTHEEQFRFIRSCGLGEYETPPQGDIGEMHFGTRSNIKFKVIPH